LAKPLQLHTEVNSVTPQPLPAIYCVSHCYNAPLPDERAPKLTVLAFDSTTNTLIPLQQTMMAEGTLMPLAQVINQKRTELIETGEKWPAESFILCGAKTSPRK